MESKGFREWLILEMTPDEAARVLGLKPGEDVKSAYRKASLRNHPDRGGSEASMKEINRAFEVLSKKKPHLEDDDDSFDWAKDPRAEPRRRPRRESYSNLDYCVQVIEEESSKKGQTRPYTFWAWDGTYFRGVFTAKTNTESFPFAAKVMEMWNDSFPHDTKAVFVDIGEKELLLLRLDRMDVSAQKRTFTHESFNSNPGNDREFVDELRNSL
jgi:curved DNA-binding protein CbpA